LHEVLLIYGHIVTQQSDGLQVGQQGFSRVLALLVHPEWLWSWPSLLSNRYKCLIPCG